MILVGGNHARKSRTPRTHENKTDISVFPQVRKSRTRNHEASHASHAIMQTRRSTNHARNHGGGPYVVGTPLSRVTSSAPAKINTPRRAMEHRPTDGPLYAVRWLREDGRDIKHRYYRRRTDADAFLTKLRAAGRHAELYRTDTIWEPA